MTHTNRDLLQAINLALLAHGSQLDKAGMPYILHPLYVMGQVDSTDAKIVAVLHDVIEDTAVTFVYNRICELVGISLWGTTYFFEDKILHALEAITHRKGETNIQYWTRVKANPLALTVKLADIAHNSSEGRLAALPKGEQERLRAKYHMAREYLLET